MTLQQLPERANLEQLKKQAKSLLAAARSQEPSAVQRFEAIFTARPFKRDTIALHDAQFVIAREHGFKSWNDLREEVEERSLTFSAAVDEFVRCATGDAKERALRLVVRHAGIAHANLFTELVLGDAEAVEGRLKANPQAARQRGGAQNWEPLLYVCHTCLHRDSAERAKGLVKIARELLRLGANPNAEYDWNWHPELPRTALWGALIAMGHIELAELLLEGGANPTDGVSMHIAAGGGGTFRRWNCCIGLAQMRTELWEAFHRLRTLWVGLGRKRPLEFGGCWSTRQIRIWRGRSRARRRCMWRRSV